MHLLRLACRLAALVLLLVSGPAWAQTGSLDAARWLPPGSDLGTALTEEPRRVEANGPADAAALVGELAFRSPAVFGRAARKVNLSCQTCHPNGHTNTRFFLAGVSDRPGNADPVNAFFHPAGDDGVFRPLNIPSLRGVAQTAPYGRDGRFVSLADFARHVIVDEFAGDPPPDWLAEALLAYLQTLDFLPAPQPSAPGRGGDLFAAHCAACHPAATDYTDGRAHDVGTGGRFVTPTLRNLADSAPYIHDGRAATLADAVTVHAAGLGLDPGDRALADITAYVAVIAAAPAPTVAVTLDRDLARFAGYLPALDTALAGRHRDRITFVVRELRRQLGLIHDRFPAIAALATPRRQLVAWSRRLQAIGEITDDTTAGNALAELRAEIAAARPGLVKFESLTLYRPENLRAQLIQSGTDGVVQGKGQPQ